MATIYDRTDLYDLLESEEKYAAARTHWETILKGKNVQSLLDVSIGTGNLTLPLLDMEIKLHGSDLSEKMLCKCREKADAKGRSVDLRVSDFRELTEHFSEQFDCVASTGNALPYVPNTEITGVLEQMDALVRPGGYLCFDMRNWDKILKDRNRFYLYNPVFHGDTRINLIQVWDYNTDGSMDFNLLFTFERENRIFQKEKFQEHYYPVAQKLLTDKLAAMGYQDVEILSHPAQLGVFDMEKTDWYCLIAKKPCEL